jgi:hypothetical protein
MNWFRNAFHKDQNDFKRDFTELVLSQIPSEHPTFKRFHVTYELYYKSPVCDASNVIAIIEKVALDALKKASVITDDNVNYHISSSWSVAGQDKLNPHCTISIQELP